MTEVHLDHPGDISWFPRHGPAKVIGPCVHECDHSLPADIAWGPDYDHYTLVECQVPDGCAGQCRAWFPEHPNGRWRMPDNWITVEVTDR